MHDAEWASDSRAVHNGVFQIEGDLLRGCPLEPSTEGRSIIQHLVGGEEDAGQEFGMETESSKLRLGCWELGGFVDPGETEATEPATVCPGRFIDRRQLELARFRGDRLMLTLCDEPPSVGHLLRYGLSRLFPDQEHA